jgi:Alpha/beta hydrolase domain
MYTNTAAEYWRGDTSLMHTDMAGTRDVEPPADSRVYLFASTQHVAGSLPLVDGNGPGEPRGRYVANAVDYAPLMRAALVNLERWIVEGMEPPASVYPHLADGTAISGAEAIAAFRQIPGLDLPDPAHLPIIRRVGLGADAARGIGHYPTEPGERYPNYVAAVDADGNEVGGIRMPDVSVPLATYTGWNPRHPETGGPEQILPMQGATFLFPRTAEARAQSGDPRPAITERYRDRADYLDQVRRAALTLADQRYLLPEDVPLAVAIAAQRYDAFMGNG